MTQPEVVSCAAPAVDQADTSKPQAGTADLWSAAGSVIAWRTQMPPLRRTEADGPVPLSVAQERLWSLEQSEPGAAYYHIPLTWDIEGELNFEALQKSFRFLAERHEALRTSFPSTEAGPIQRVNGDAPSLAMEDVSQFPNGEARTEAWTRASRFVQQ